MSQRKSDLQDVAFLLEMASRNLMRARQKVQNVDSIGQDQIDRAITNVDDVLMLVRSLAEKERT